MGRKKAVFGSVVEVDIPQQAPQAPVAPVAEKTKREVSEKQLENLKKGMAILKAKREAKSKKEDIVETPPPLPVAPPPPVAPPQPVVSAPEPTKKERKPRVVKNYLTTDDFNNFKNELLTTLKKPDTTTPNYPLPPIKEVVKEVIKEVPLAPVKERLITGRELLDRLFFSN